MSDRNGPFPVSIVSYTQAQRRLQAMASLRQLCPRGYESFNTTMASWRNGPYSVCIRLDAHVADNCCAFCMPRRSKVPKYSQARNHVRVVTSSMVPSSSVTQWFDLAKCTPGMQSGKRTSNCKPGLLRFRPNKPYIYRQLCHQQVQRKLA